MAVSDHNLIWVDMEMTGLVPEEHRVIEIATIVTDTDLNVLAEGPVIAVHQSPDTLQAMDEWNTRTHTNSGLVERVRGSAVSEEEATHLTLAFLERWVPCGPIADVRKFHLPGSSLHGASHASARAVFSLPKSGCQYSENIDAALAA